MEQPPGDVVVVRAVRSGVPRWLLVLYGFQLVLSVVTAVLDPRPFRVALAALWFVLVAGALAVLAVERRRPPELHLGPSGVVVRRAVGPTRVMPWSDITDLTVDLPGGSRTVRVTDRRKRQWPLLTIGDADVGRVRARWAREAASRGSDAGEQGAQRPG